MGEAREIAAERWKVPGIDSEFEPILLAEWVRETR